MKDDKEKAKIDWRSILAGMLADLIVGILLIKISEII